MTAIDYKKVFSKLSHIKALSHDGKFDQIVQNVIMLALFQACDIQLRNERDVSDKIDEIYGISIRALVIQSNLDKLVSAGDILRDKSTKQYILSQGASYKISSRLEDAQQLEMSVKKKWFKELEVIFGEIDAEKLEKFWVCLKGYLSNVFEQHGIQTIQLLNPNSKINQDDQKGLSYIVEKVVKENNCQFSKDDLSLAINQFIIKADEERAEYTSQLVDATFTSFALTSDAEIVNFLNTRYNHLSLFLDTNFIFGILDLHKNSEDASAREILKEVRTNRLPFKLYYHPETLAEFKRAFDSKALYIKASKWTKESSRLALTVDGLSPLEELFHKENIEGEVDPLIFLDKYEHVDLMLQDFGLNEYMPYQISDLEHGEIDFEIGEYQKFIEAIPNRKQKSYYGFKHDIVVLREVRNLNPKKSKFLDSHAFFISSDFVLAKFEKAFYKKSWEINYVVSPSVFLQLIRPFIQSDYNSNKRFIDTFSIPEFRSFEIDYSATRSKTLQILNDNYHDASFETKVKILRDQVLLEKLEKVTGNYEQQVQIIENQIAIENRILAQQMIKAEESTKLLSSEKDIIQQDEIKARFALAEKVKDIHNLKNTFEEVSLKKDIDFNKEILAELTKSIKVSESSLIRLQAVISAKVRRHKLVLGLITLLFYAIMILLIYKFSWDVMEPVTYIVSALFLGVGYAYLAITGSNFNPKRYFEYRKSQICESVYRKFSFDTDELERLRARAQEIRNTISELEGRLTK